MEKPRFVFAFGPTQDCYFVGCGEDMEWNKLPAELESILVNRAASVISISLGEHAFYCRYVSRRNGEQYTVSGGLPSNLSFLLSCWHANPYELPHIAFGPSGSFFFQSSALAAWEKLPARLSTLLTELREASSEAEIPARALALGFDGSFVFLTGQDGEFPFWDGIDGELAHRLSGGDEENIVVESAALSLASKDDYLVVFSDGSIFYSVPDAMLPVVQRFVQKYHLALAEYDQTVGFEEYPFRPISPREEMLAAREAGGKNHRGFSLELPDGILGWDEKLITRFIENAMGPQSDGTSTPPSSPLADMALGRASPYPRPASKRGIGGGGVARKLGSWMGTDYAASWVEKQLAQGNVIEL